MKAKILLKYGLLLFMFITGREATAIVRYVKPLGSGSESGENWGAASGNLQAMIDASVTGDEIWVAAGTYSPAPSGASFNMKDGVKIYGGFPASGSPVFTDREATVNLTILHGNNASVIYNDQAVFGTAVTASAVLDGFTITGGADTYGGGMWNVQSSPTISNCIFSGNTATSYGGGLFSQQSSPIVSNCTFSNNTAPAGAGVMSYQSSPAFTNCSFVENTATTGFGGGGMYNWSCPSTLTITGCTFSNNEGAGGAGIYNYYSSPVITNCTLTANDVMGGSGGGMYNEFSAPSITGTVFSENTANGGGGMFNWGLASKPVINNCTFTQNKAKIGGGAMWNNYSAAPLISSSIFKENDGDSDDDGTSYGGGAICNSYSSLQVSNSSFLGNKANSGGAVRIEGASSTNVSPLIINCVVTGNVAKSNGGGGLSLSGSPGSVLMNCTVSGNRTTYRLGADAGGGGILYGPNYSATITNSIIHFNGNGLDQFDNIKSSNGTITASVTYSIVQGGHTGTGNLNTDPFFNGPLAYIQAPNSAGDYTLESGSPAIGAGNNAAYEAIGDLALDKDRAGNVRLTSTNIDMGAYEWNSPLPVTLLHFTAQRQENAVVLSWQTTQEINSERFDIQHSMDGKQWIRIGSLLSAGESADLTHYTYTHTSAVNGQNLYRLKMVDKDGSFAYSRIVSLQMNKEISISIFPNPVSSRANIISDLPITGYQLTTVTGQTVKKAQNLNNTAVELNLENLNPALYMLTLTSENGRKSTHKLLVERK